MTQPQQPNALLAHPTVQRVIRRTAGELAGRSDFASDDFADIVGALRVLVGIRLQSFDAARSGLHTYATHIARSAAATLIKSRHRAKRRGDFSSRSFEDLPPDPNGDARCAETISEADAARRRGADVRDPIDDLITRRSIDEIVAKLHPDLVIVVRVLREDAPAAAADRLGISRHRMRVLIAELREHFRRGGLGH
jgi:DNA-directed RNA polymerase specialized sigma24 family protein